MLGYADAGLPILIVGAPPNQTPGLPTSQDAELQVLVKKLLAHVRVKLGRDEATIILAQGRQSLKGTEDSFPGNQALSI